MKNLSLTLLALLLSIASFAQAPSVISGPSAMCMGTDTTYTDSVAGGTWSSSNTSLGTIDAVTGAFMSIAPGSVTLTYTTSGGSATLPVFINSLPPVFVVSGGGYYCAGGVGEDIILSGTNTGIVYGLYRGTTPISTFPGTGSGVDFGYLTLAGTYTVWATNSGTGCTDSMSGSATITILSSPAAITGPSAVCSGGTITLSDASPGGTWSSSSTAVATVSATGVVEGVTPGAATIIYTTSGGCSTSVTITVNPLPAPVSGPSFLCAGAPVGETDATPGGTWSSNNVIIATITGSGSVTGVTAGTAIISYAMPTGCAATKTVTVNSAPDALSGTFTGCVGGTISIFDTITGGTWSSSDPAVVSTGGITGVSPGTAALTYTLSSGCAVSAVVTVNSAPISHSVSASGYCSGSPGGTIYLDGSDIGTNYQLVLFGTATGVPKAGTGLPLEWLPLPDTGTYTVVASLGSGCSATMPGPPAHIIINPLPPTNTLRGGGGYCYGGTGVDIYLLSYSGYSYQLFDSTMPIGSPIFGSAGTVDFGLDTLPGTFSATVTDPITGCTAAMTGTVTVSVNPLPNIYAVTGGGGYCAGGAGVPIGVNGSDAGVNYQLYNGSSLVGTPVLGTGASLTFGLQTAAGTYAVLATNTSGCSDTMSGSAIVTIATVPTIYSITGGGNYCAGSAGPSIGLDGSAIGVNYTLDSGGSAILTLPGTGLAMDFGVHFSGTYTIIAGSGCTADMAGTAVVSANALPATYSITGGGNYCTGGTGVHIGLSGSNSGINYQLYLGITAISSPVAGSGSTLDFGLQTATGVYTVVATNAATSCTSNMTGSSTVALSPLPDVYTVTGGGSYCAGGAGVHVDLSSSDAGVNYQLLLGTSPFGSPIAGSGSAIDFGLEAAAATFTVVATNATTGCSSNMAGSAIVTITPLVVPSISLSASTGDTVCGGTVVTFSTTSSGGGTPTFAWSVNGTSTGTGGSSYSYSPADGDVVGVVMTSSAACATPSATSSDVTMTVFPMPTAISGSTGVCIGSTTSLTDGTAGGIWTGSSSIASVGTIGGTTGVVTGITAGLDTITYAMGGGCIATTVVTISAVPSVTASSAGSCGGDYTLTASGATTYSWSPATGLSCATCATTNIDPTTTTTYIVTGANAGGCSDTASVTVNGNRISGHITIGASGTIKVWLIQFNASDSSISALDSTTACTSGGEPYFEFDGPISGNYMVKANLLGGTPGTSGYVPTYSLSSTHWDSAATVTHAASTDTMHINMLYGTVPPGPGFIGGFVASGAGKGTSGSAPVRGMMIYLIDAATNEVRTYTYTDAAGNYSFSGLGYGNYKVYPEDYQYTTTPSAWITISTSSEIITGINFKQHTTSRTITPFDYTEVKTLTSNGELLTIYPNPVADKLNMQWKNQLTGNAVIMITDVVGREVYRSMVNINTASGQAQIELRNVNNGIYLLTIKSEGINYSGKLVVEH